MFKNHLLITFRSMMKNKFFIITNVIGMGVAIACCIVGYFAHEYDATYDRIHKNINQIYRVSTIREFENEEKKFAFVPFPLGDVVDKTFQDVDKSTRYLHSYSNFKRDNDLFSANLSYVDPDFFQIFSFEFISGNPADLKDKTSVFISDVVAIRLFRTPAEAYGKTITQVYGNELKELKVAGVYREPPMNSSHYKPRGSAYMNFENYKDEHKDVREDDWRKEGTLFVQINNANELASVDQQLQPYIENNNKVREDFQIKKFVLDPLTTMAHDDRAQVVDAATWVAPPQSAIIGSMIMGCLILLIACFNLTNTAIAISSRRLKEIGIRKVMGSMRKQLIIQFIGETMSVCFLALIVGLGIADLLVSGWNTMWEFMQLTPHYFDNPSFLFFMIGVLVFTGILAGSYPAFYISKFEPVTILKGKLQFGGTNYFTRTLLGLQFAISLIAIVSAIGFIQNAKYQQEYDLGFDMQGSIIAWFENPQEFDKYRNALQSNPDVISMAGAKSGIFSNREHQPVKQGTLQSEVDIIDVGDNYLRTMDLKLVSGRDFKKDSKTDQKESVIITEKMAKLFNLDNAIGKEFIWKDTVKYYVVGVVKDVYTSGLWRELEPMMIRYVLPDQYTQIAVSAKTENVANVNTYMTEQWSVLFPTRIYNGHMLAEEKYEMVVINLNIMYMYVFLGAIAMMLSVTGLFTLVSLNIIKRMKEIGVRKVLGASVGNITRIVNTEFVIILTIAAVFGSWASYNMNNALMGSIWKYYQSVNALTFVIAIGLMFFISFLTIGFKIMSVATMNPVKSLRDE
ncbi:MAG TPA: ABC transporter permease [Chryseolinea sp.]|nr:ABC transporter permease [Chryseolinea sp.]HPM30049.1 ABC transporter permease [Chryseolinea sp.]